jgi:GDP-4-dehydro-6-deoxy-D-mannose reductase
MRILVTGACGFVGGHLVDRLVRAGHHLVAAIQNPAAMFDPSVQKISFELTQPAEVRIALREAAPDVVIHLAAQSMVVKSWEDPVGTMQVNTLGTLHLLETLREWPQTLLITIGSSDEYGLAGQSGRSLVEEIPCQPQNPYAVSKFAAGQLAMQLAHKHGLLVNHLRPFNHFGPGQRAGYVVSDFCSQIARIEKGETAPVITVGDLSAQRDFTDVRDVIAAYALIAERRLPTGIYNICSGQPRCVDDILRFLLRQAKVRIDVQVDPGRLRPSDVPFFVGSADKLCTATGWSPQRDFQASLVETLDWWRTL